MAFNSGSGGAARGGWSYPPVLTRNLMTEPGVRLSPQEAFAQGCGKAHRQVVYAHFEFRNYDRSSNPNTRGVVGPSQNGNGG